MRPLLILSTLVAAFLALVVGIPGAHAADIVEEHFDIDDRGLLATYVGPLGLETHFSYDAEDRLIRVDGPSDSAQFGYDPAGRHSWTSDDVATVWYDYDALDQLRAVRFEVSRAGQIVVARTIRYQHDDLGEVRALTLAGEGDAADYTVEMSRDLGGRLLSVIIGGTSASFTYTSDAGGSVVTRTLPSGMTTVLQKDPLGLPLSISHSLQPGAEAFQAIEATYDLGIGTATLTEETAGAISTRRIDLSLDPPRIFSDEMEAILRFGADSRVMESTIGGTTRYFLNAPIGPDVGLVIETDPTGTPERAFFAAEDISIEHAFADKPIVYLERPGSDPLAPLVSQATQNVSLARASDVVDETRGETIVALPPSLGELDATLILLKAVKRYAKIYKSAAAYKHARGTGSAYEGDALLDAIRRLDPELGGEIAQRLPDGFKLYEVIDGGRAVLADIQGLAGQDMTLEQKLWRHGVVGELSEVFAKYKVGQALKQVHFAKRFPVKANLITESIGVAYDLMRGRALLSADVVEHGLDAGAWTATYYAALPFGGPASAAATADLATAVVAAIRKSTEASELQHARRRAVAAPGQTGRYIQLAANAVLRGNLDYFMSHHSVVGERASIFSTVMGGDSRHRSSFVHQRNRAYGEFQRLLEAGDADGLSRMLRNDRHVRKALLQAGVAVKDIESLARSLAANAPPPMVPLEVSRIERPGGIDLAIDGAAFPSVGQLEGAVIAATGRVAIVGDGDLRLPPIDPELLAVALIVAFRDDVPDPQFSLDPIDPGDPNSWQEAVYLPADLLAATLAGQWMYEADLDLKLLAFGCQTTYGPWQQTESGGTTVRGPVEVWFSNRFQAMDLAPRAALWPGFESVPELSLRSADGTGASVRARQWIVVERVEVHEADGAITFGEVKLGVRARRQEIGPDGKLRDVAADDPAATAFAAQLTAQYDAVAERVPSFAKLKEFVKALALAKWLARSGAETDLGWAIDLVNARADSVRQVSTLHWRFEDTKQELTVDARRRSIRRMTRAVEISGGVDLSFEPVWLPANEATHALATAALARLEQADAPAFALDAEDRAFAPLAVVLPANRAGQALWARQPAGMIDGLEVALDDRGRLVRAADTLGSRATYTWSDDGLVGMTLLEPDGRLTRFAVPEGAAVLSETTSAGVIELRDTPTGLEFFVDRKLEWRYRVGADGAVVAVEHPASGMVTEIVRDPDGALVALRRLHTDDRATAETLSLDASPATASPPETDPSPREVRIDLAGLPVEATFDADGFLASAKVGDSWRAEIDIDPATGLGQGRLGDQSFVISEPVAGLTRITVSGPLN